MSMGYSSIPLEKKGEFLKNELLHQFQLQISKKQELLKGISNWEEFARREVLFRLLLDVFL